MKAILKTRKGQSLFWLIVGIGCAIVMFTTGITFMSVGKDSLFDHYEIPKTIVALSAMCLSGASFGFSLQALLEDQPLLPMVGIFLWPAIFVLFIVLLNWY